MTEFKIRDFITALKHVVMFNSADDICYRLNGFAVIDDTFNWDTDSIEAKAEKEFYFSRDQQRMLYPALAVSFASESLGNYRNDKYNDHCRKLAIGVVDQINTDCVNCTPCQKRGKEEIYMDASALLLKVMNTISNIKLYKTLKDAVVGYLWSHPDIIAMLITEGVYDSATIEMSESSVVKSMFEKNNPNPNMIEIPVTKQNTLAKYVTIDVCEFCAPGSMEFTFKKYKGQNCC